MSDEFKRMKRRNGKWVHADDPDRSPVFREVATRLWWLIVPLVGIVCSQDAYVRPELMEAQNRINREKVALGKMQDSLKAEVRKVEAEVLNVTADHDSTYLPQVSERHMLLDSLRAERSLFDRALPQIVARAESLRAVNSELQGYLTQASADLQARQATIDSLKARRATLNDSIRTVSLDLVALSDTWDRLANPDKYRKNTALVPGAGNFPNRDELPKR